jgi:hypothetical protein
VKTGCRSGTEGVEWKTDIGNSLRCTLKSPCGAAPERWMNLTVMTLWIGTRGARRRKAAFLLPPGDEETSYFGRRATGGIPAGGFG